MQKKYLIGMGMFLFFLASTAWSVPLPMPTRIGVTLTIIEVTQITNENCELPKSTACQNYTIEVKRPDGTSFEPVAKATVMNSFDIYLIDIPIYEKDSQPEGANPGDMAVIHVYDECGKELTVKTPPEGHIIVGNSGDSVGINLVVILRFHGLLMEKHLQVKI